MSWRASGYVKHLNEGLTRGEKLMLLVLADYYSDEEEAAWPSLKRLATECLMTTESARRVRLNLSRKGLITVERRPRVDGTFQSSLVHFPRLVNVQLEGGTPYPSRGGPPTGVRDEPTVEPSGEEEDKSSSSSSADSTLGAGWVTQLKDWYASLPPGLSSPIRAPSRYFQTVRKNGDIPPACDLAKVFRICAKVQQAFTQDHPEGSPRRKERYTVPLPDQLPGLEQAWHTLNKWEPSRHGIRIALMQFVQYDEDRSDEIEPVTLLSRIARRPDLFDRAVENQQQER